MKTSAKESTGLAGGKIILLGEHAVVHGKSSLAVGLENRVKVLATPKNGPITLSVPNWNYKAVINGPNKGDLALRNLVSKLEIDHFGVMLRGKTNLPARAGMGASAAIAGAAARSLMSYFGKPVDYDTLFDAVQEWEKIFHGNPSGLDAAVVLKSGISRFCRKSGIEEIHTAPPQLLVVHSGKEKDTSRMVALFNSVLTKNPVEGQQHLDQIGQLVEEGIEALKGGDMQKLGETMNENQELLKWFGISTDTLDDICKVARHAGALGAKLTGGGGGGCAVILVANHTRKTVEKALLDSGYSTVKP